MEKADWEQEIERILEESEGKAPSKLSAIIHCVQKLNCLPGADYEALKYVIEYLLSSKTSNIAMAAAFDLGRAYEKAKSLGVVDVWESR